IPLLLLLQGLGEDEKITIIWIGVFFQLVLIVMDIAHRVPAEMLNVAYTLGASRWTVFYKVFLPATFPEVVDALRITMDWAWTYLIVPELVASAQLGQCAGRPVRVQRRPVGLRQIDAPDGRGGPRHAHGRRSARERKANVRARGRSGNGVPVLLALSVALGASQHRVRAGDKEG